MSGATVPTRVGVSASALLAATVYLAVALGGRALPAGEVFPFFSWDLFSTVPGETLRAAVYVDGIDGSDLPVAEELLSSRFSRGSKVVASQLANDLLLSIRSGTVEERAVSALVANHLPASAAWSLRVETYEPIERFRHGTVDTVVVQRFHGEVVVEAPVWLSPDASELLSASGRWRLESGVSGGRLEERGRTAGGTMLSGWAGDTTAGLLPVRVVAVATDRVLASSPVGLPRADVRDVHGHRSLLASGFRLFVPGDGVPSAEMRVFALFSDGTARMLS